MSEVVSHKDPFCKWLMLREGEQRGRQWRRQDSSKGGAEAEGR